MQTKSNREDFVRLVPSLPSGESEFDRCVVREALKKNGVRFSEQQVILILQIAPGTPGVISRIENVLLNKVEILALYLAEETRLVLSVSTCKRRFGYCRCYKEIGYMVKK